MKISPLAPALWISGMAALILGLIDKVIGLGFFDPVIAILYYMLAYEGSKFVAELTMEEDDGTDSNS